MERTRTLATQSNVDWRFPRGFVHCTAEIAKIASDQTVSIRESLRDRAPQQFTFMISGLISGAADAVTTCRSIGAGARFIAFSNTRFSILVFEYSFSKPCSNIFEYSNNRFSTDNYGQWWVWQFTWKKKSLKIGNRWLERMSTQGKSRFVSSRWKQLDALYGCYNSSVILVKQRTSAIIVNPSVVQTCSRGPTPQVCVGHNWLHLMITIRLPE